MSLVAFWGHAGRGDNTFKTGGRDLSKRFLLH